MITLVSRFHHWLGILGGFERPSDEVFGSARFIVFRVVTWLFLLLAAYMFMGRGAKFIYVDF